jgi:hypothetical protein
MSFNYAARPTKVHLVAPQKLSDLLPLRRAARQNGVFIAARCALPHYFIV